MDPLEPYYQIVTSVYLICVTIFSAYCYVLWVRPYLPGNRKAASRDEAPGSKGRPRGMRGSLPWPFSGLSARLWGIGAAYVVTMQIMQWIPVVVSNVLAYGLGTLAAFLIMCLTDRRHFGQKVFLAVTFFCMRWQAWIIDANVSSWMSRRQNSFILSTKDHGRLSFIYELATESYEFWFRMYVVDVIIDFVLGTALLYGAVRLMLRVCSGGQEYMRGKELLLLIVPSVAGAFTYGMVKFYDTAYESESGKSVYDLPGYSPLLVLYSLVSYITILAIVYVFRKWKQEQEADGQRKIFVTQMKDMQSHIMEVERLYSDLRRLRHDMANHLMTLEQLYGREEYEAAGRYAGSLKAEVQGMSFPIESGNPVTDAILSGREKEMEEKGISFTCGFHYPQKGKTDAFDISIILNNALNNAIEAACREKRREVFLVSRRVRNMYMIEVANAFTGELGMEGPGGLPSTTKAEEGHGFGLTSIRHVARKYYGDIEIKVEEYAGRRCCVLRVMLQIADD